MINFFFKTDIESENTINLSADAELKKFLTIPDTKSSFWCINSTGAEKVGCAESSMFMGRKRMFAKVRERAQLGSSPLARTTSTFWRAKLTLNLTPQQIRLRSDL